MPRKHLEHLDGTAVRLGELLGNTSQRDATLTEQRWDHLDQLGLCRQGPRHDQASWPRKKALPSDAL
jgi:hypothetical protein